jgi:quercetin dioxygenase-like cupin family protein
MPLCRFTALARTDSNTHERVKMNVVRRKPAHEDPRGTITDILEDDDVECVTLITSSEGAVRGNHYHKETIEYTYILSGRMRVLEQVPGGLVEEHVLEPGDLLTTPPLVRHTLVAVEDSTFIACAHGPRRGKKYEDDTFRLEEPLWPPSV